MIPKAVQEQADASDKALEATAQAEPGGRVAQANEEGASAPTPAPASPEPTATPQSTEAPPSILSDDPAEGGGEPRMVPKEDYDMLLQRYKSFQGTFSSINAQNDTLKRENEAMKAQIAAGGSNAPAGSEKSPELKYLDEDTIEDFGPEVLDVQARVARGEAENVVTRMKREILEEVRHESAQATPPASTVWDQVEAEFPGAKQIDAENVRWWNWLDNTIEPVSGKPYIQHAIDAQNIGDANRLLNIMKAFAASEGIPTPERSRVESQVRPNRSRGGDSRPGSKPVYAESEIQRFYTDVSRGKYSDEPDKARALDEQYTQAGIEGRVLVGR